MYIQKYFIILAYVYFQQKKNGISLWLSNPIQLCQVVEDWSYGSYFDPEEPADLSYPEVTRGLGYLGTSQVEPEFMAY